MSKIELQDTAQDIIVKMSEGNSGALSVCVLTLKTGSDIDPDGFMGGMGALLGMDTLGIYGSKIWMLYKDVCGSNLSVMLAILRANQLGFLSTSELMASIENRGNDLDIDSICKQVQKNLPNFVLQKDEKEKS